MSSIMLASVLFLKFLWLQWENEKILWTILFFLCKTSEQHQRTKTSFWERKITIKNHILRHMGGKCFWKDVCHEEFIFLAKGGSLAGENALWIYEKALKFVGCTGPYVWNHENHDNVLRDLITNCCLMWFFFSAFHIEKFVGREWEVHNLKKKLLS